MKNTKCPYCGKELEKGYIQSPRPISWLPRKIKMFTGANFTEKGAVILSEGSVLSAPCVIAYNCSSCKAIIIGYEDNSCDFYSEKN
ncbi:MAG: PF20097 family protein [Marvinbryantia sp.]|uniref:PF20097 family protein n=1 Tax=Marvinbryantia sp. TaxID=2496532 RepID=UPI00399B06C4